MADARVNVRINPRLGTSLRALIEKYGGQHGCVLPDTLVIGDVYRCPAQCGTVWEAVSRGTYLVWEVVTDGAHP